MKQLIEKLGKKFYVILAAVLVVIIALVAVIAVSCGSNGPTGTQGGTQGGVENGVQTTYTVSLKTVGGMALSDIDVYVYADDTLADLKSFAKTDANGIVSFSLPANDSYAIAFSGIPKGYDVQSSYSFSGDTAIITVSSSLITDEDISATTLGVGDVMYDFTVTTSDGEKVTLSEVLKEKKLVVLNFWYTTCSWCLTEFPIMDEVYQFYTDDVAIIALDPLDGAAAVKSFKETYQYSFAMADCPASWANTFGVTGYPTSVFIDQYGVICAVEAGAITSKTPFVSVFEHFTADDYQQVLSTEGVSAFVTQVKPTYTMPTSDEIAAVLNKSGIAATYRAEEGDGAEYIWPFAIGEKLGEQCIYATNKEIEDSYAIVYIDVELKAGQAVGLDYLASSEQGADIMYVIVNDEAIFNISGWDEKESWKTCYPCIADEDGIYEIALCYSKDSDTNEADDTVYVKNLRVVDVDDIDTATYIPREAAKTEDGFEYTYADIVYNESDGYYHVGSKNGPLLLADLMGYTQFNEELCVYEILLDKGTLKIDGVECYDLFVTYCNYASNSTLNGVCTVTKELATLLKQFAKVAGFDNNDENEWLKICKYYDAYGTKTQLEDPIKGLAIFSAYEAKLGKNVSTNYFYYNRVIMPRGLMAEFTPSKSGVYRITSHNSSEQGVNGWLFDENRNQLLAYEHDERMFEGDEVSMVYYMEAGKSYYIDIAYWDVYEVGTIKYDIEYIGASYELFRLASPGYFTYDSDATGEAMYHIIAGGIDVVLGSDGIWYEDLGTDSNGKQIYGSKLYVDFTGITGVFSNPITTNSGVTGMIEMGGFDFSKSENDMYILSVYEAQDNDWDKVVTYLKESWGDDYEAYVKEYQLEDIMAGRYHGSGKDYTSEIQKYVSQIDKSSNTERNGCVVATKELTDILQLLMDKYTFEDVDNSWTKLCYYYDYLGPEK